MSMKISFYRARLVGGLLLFLSCCKKHVHTDGAIDSWTAREHEARLGNVPAALDFRLKRRLLTGGQTKTVYKTNRSPDDVVDFYQRAMPQQGWEQRCLIREKQSILVFEKNFQTAVLTVANNGKKQTTIELFLCS